jgi:hypothetical protein
MAYKSTIQDTPRGPIQLVVEDATGLRASVFNRQFPAGSPLAVKGNVLYVASGDYGLSLNTAASTLLPTVIASHARVAARNILRTPFMAFMAAGQAEGQKVAKATIEAMSVVPATLATRPIRDRAIKQWDAMDNAGKARAITEWPLEKLAALVEVSALETLDDSLATIARDRYMILRHIEKTGLSAGFAKKPNAQNPLVFGVDDDAAYAASETSLNRLKSDIADIENATAVLRDVTTMVALSCETTIDNAFAILTNTQA